MDFPFESGDGLEALQGRQGERWQQTLRLFAKHGFTWEQRLASLEGYRPTSGQRWKDILAQAQQEVFEEAATTFAESPRKLYRLKPNRAMAWPFLQVYERLVRPDLARLPLLQSQALLADALAALSQVAGRSIGKIRASFDKEEDCWAYLQQHYWEALKSTPILCRLLAACTLQQVDATKLIVSRLCEDEEALVAAGFLKAGSQCTSIAPGYSDPHRQGATVAVLHFSEGERLVYKPRPLQLDHAFHQFAQWLNKQYGGEAVRTVACLPKEGYGWMAFVEELPPQMPAYAHSLGRLYAVFHFLGATDMHPGNFIPQGSHAVPIDLECLLSHGYSEGHELPATLFNGMAPSWQFSKDRKHSHYSWGLADGPRPWVLPVPVFGTDLKVSYQSHTAPAAQQGIGGKIAPASAIHAFMEGFALLYGLMEEIKEEATSRLSVFEGCASRTVFRGTQDYQDALFLSVAPDRLADGHAYFVGSERAFTHIPFAVDGEARHEALHYEKNALMRRDVPMFYGYTDQTGIYTGDGQWLGNMAGHSPLALARRRLSAASSQNYRQLEALYWALFRSIEVSEADCRLPSNLDRLGLARHIAEAVVRQYMPAWNAWLDFFPTDKNDVSAMPALCPTPLYEGSDGNAIFLHEAGIVFKNEGYILLAAKVLLGNLEKVEALLAGDALVSPCAFTGAPMSLLFALMRTGMRTEARALLERLLALPYGRWAVHRHDYVGGLSSGMVVLARAHALLGAPQALELAAAFAHDLQECIPDGGKLGMAHGAAGWAFALWTLHESLPASNFGQQAEAHWGGLPAWEEGNLPAHAFWWCAGLPGMALSRLACGGVAPEVGRAGERLLAQWQGAAAKDGMSHLCCGQAGRIMAMGHFDERLALSWADEMAKGFAKDGKWHYQLFREGNIVPGIMSGAPGIGMALLGGKGILTLEV